MNQFHNHCEINVACTERSRRRAREEGQHRSKAFSAATARVLEISFDGRIESLRLFSNSLLDSVEMWVNQLNGSLKFGCPDALKSRLRENFHEPIVVWIANVVNFDNRRFWIESPQPGN